MKPLFRRIMICLSGLALHSAQADVAPDGVTLVQDGVPQCVIVVASNPIRSTCFAAYELQQHVQKITGAKLPIIREGDFTNGFPIYVGQSQKVRDLGLKDHAMGYETYAVKFFPDCIVLTGPIDDGNVVPMGESVEVTKPSENLWMQRGPLYAVYDFLEKDCDVRWYTPGDIGTIYPTMKTLTVKPMDYIRQPAVKGRQSGWGAGFGMWGETSQDDVKLFYLRNKEGGSMNHGFCHSFEGFPARFSHADSSHPELFERDEPDFFSRDQGVGQMCFSSTGLLAQTIQDARHFFDTGELKYRSAGGGDVYEIVPRDTGINCTCEKCKALLGASSGSFNSGKSSTIFWTFANNVANAIAQSHPGKYIGCLAYLDYAVPPEGMTIASNIYVGPALGTRTWINGGGEDMALYKGWVKAAPGRVRSMWLYPCFPNESTSTRGYHCFPALMPHNLADQMKMFTSDGVLSFNMCGSWELLECYLSLKYQDDPNRDTEAFISEFFTRFYGAAAEPMKKLYLGIEAAYWDPKNYPNGQYSCDQSVCWGTLGSTERMTKWQGYMDEAKQLASSDAEKKRVATFENSLWKFMKEGKADWEFKKDSAADVEKLKSLPPPSATIARVDVAPDGDINKVDWSKVEKLKINRANDGFPSKDRNADLQMAHDGVNFYIHLHENGDASQFKNDGWFFGHRWELFYGPSRTGDQNTNATYRQVALHVGSKMDVWREDSLYTGVVYSSENNALGWDMKLTIPLAQINDHGVKPGEKFYMNFIRGAFDGSSTLAFSPIFQVMYHCPTRFAEFTLAE